MYPKVTLKAARDAAVRGGHPWVFSGAVARTEAAVQDGGLVSVFGEGGHFLGHGYYNGRSAIRVRLLTHEAGRPIDGAFWRERLERAMALRRAWFGAGETDAYRLVNGEGDGLPGLICDRYAGCLVVQFHTLGMEANRELILATLRELDQPEALVERSDLEVRRKEGLLPLAPRLLAGNLDAQGVTIREHGLRFRVDLLGGQKTGFYLDQRDNRRAVEGLAAGRRVLNCFAYTGAFTLAALRGGAREAVSVESSAPALERLARHLTMNDMAGAEHREVRGDAGEFLEQAAGEGARYDLIVLDPPAFVKQRAALKSGLNAYRRLNRLALRLLPPGGILVTASCSSHVGPGDWESLVYSAARMEGRAVQVLRQSFHPIDHPILLQCPEGRYLKCLFVRTLD